LRRDAFCLTLVRYAVCTAVYVDHVKTYSSQTWLSRRWRSRHKRATQCESV